MAVESNNMEGKMKDEVICLEQMYHNLYTSLHLAPSPWFLCLLYQGLPLYSLIRPNSVIHTPTKLHLLTGILYHLVKNFDSAQLTSPARLVVV